MHNQHITAYYYMHNIQHLFISYGGAFCTPGARGAPGDCLRHAEAPRRCSKQGEDHLLLFSVLLLQCSTMLEPNEFIRGRSLYGRADFWSGLGWGHAANSQVHVVMAWN